MNSIGVFAHSYLRTFVGLTHSSSPALAIHNNNNNNIMPCVRVNELCTAACFIDVISA